MIRNAVGAIVFQNDKFLIVNKITINTIKGKESIDGEWDFIKGGVKECDIDLNCSILRELKEETGCTDFKIIKQFDEKIRFDFPTELISKVGFTKQETTMFLVEYIGGVNSISPPDNEISDFLLLDRNSVLDKLTHSDTKDYFLKQFAL